MDLSACWKGIFGGLMYAMHAFMSYAGFVGRASITLDGIEMITHVEIIFWSLPSLILDFVILGNN